MAVRGRKPTATILKLVTGNPGKRALPDGEVLVSGTPQKPKHLRGRAATLWAEVSALCWWLGEADGYKLGMWCALQAEFERGSAKMLAARINALRALGSELGLDPASRARMGGGKTKPPNADEKPDPAKKYFSA